MNLRNFSLAKFGKYEDFPYLCIIKLRENIFINYNSLI